MQRYLSLRHPSRRPSLPVTVEGTSAQNSDATDTNADAADTNADEKSELTKTGIPTATTAALPTEPSTKVKRVDNYYSSWSRTWKYRNTGARVVPEMQRSAGDATTDPWAAYCFVVVRTIPRDPNDDPTFKVTVKSAYLREVCKDVMQVVDGLSWNAEPLEISPQLLVAFHPHFTTYHAELQAKPMPTPSERACLDAVSALLRYLETDYRSTLARIRNLTAHGEITFDLLYALLVPRTILITSCPSTGAPLALRLRSASLVHTLTSAFYDVVCESIDAIDFESDVGTQGSVDATLRRTGGGRTIGRVESRVLLVKFNGTVKIASLDAYPLDFHPDSKEQKRQLIERGRKWVSMMGVRHVYYRGRGAFAVSGGRCKRYAKFNIDSRVMVDRGDTRFANIIEIVPSMLQIDEIDITDEELMLTTPVIYGFSLSDKLWLELNIQHIELIRWNPHAFANLVLPGARRALLQSLVEAHNAELGFDDFVPGKGAGLVINLFGPPGVGKTLSAEATSEHVKRPLYVVGGGDLGTHAEGVDARLKEVFEVATRWRAIVLIDEADVFLERRSMHDLKRNAMVAVFLRHVEYYRGILFLTTNRIKAFDEAFLSRIHVALHFTHLSKEAKAQVWRAFLLKAGMAESELDDAMVNVLAKREINGRQIKNATRTAHSLAVSRSERLRLSHILETLDAMEAFAEEFAAVSPR
ncbi:nucleoside triphosphate hydrolase protein [Wolfiporia cocos MD-104 SS10]|uniref:Nucleoside triphosphate hydrolase protein n=1 Tax=Wolfiporia cocos (strain MD-104) TaxID=742152 RepID=A0A2H3J3F8_WOLCO|nr:nucleoside triphosphate hydrolase protein [Wolfiporia cocos MD-104 SS10]